MIQIFAAQTSEVDRRRQPRLAAPGCISARLLSKARCIAPAPGLLIAPLPSLFLQQAHARVTFDQFFDRNCIITQTQSGQRRPKSGCQARPLVRRRASRPARRRQTFAESRASSLLVPSVFASPSRIICKITTRYGRSMEEKGSGGQGEQGNERGKLKP